MKSDLILNKVSKIERCIRRIYEEYGQNPKNLEHYTKQDSIILNLQRASEASVNLAMHIVATKKLGLPSNTRDAFTLLETEGILSPILSSKMKDLISFSKKAVQNPNGINLVHLQTILDTHLVIYFEFTKTIILF
ncbi:HepT-like ribonuclease domain-containing protein [Niallia taxi]|uniref:type VII toxin-antitoxin system HepT family RNase toxin n=1 Tax=Niallia taxi TaxID=2499688 RepID=UPI003981F6E7